MAIIGHLTNHKDLDKIKALVMIKAQFALSVRATILFSVYLNKLHQFENWYLDARLSYQTKKMKLLEKQKKAAI